MGSFFMFQLRLKRPREIKKRNGTMNEKIPPTLKQTTTKATTPVTTTQTTTTTTTTTQTTTTQTTTPATEILTPRAIQEITTTTIHHLL